MAALHLASQIREVSLVIFTDAITPGSVTVTLTGYTRVHSFLLNSSPQNKVTVIKCKGPWLYACHIPAVGGNNVMKINSVTRR